MPKPKTVDVLAELAESLKALTERVKGIEERLAEPHTEHPSKEESTPQVASSTVYVKERELVNEVLNKHFDFRVEHELGGFRFVVLVPKKYSDASGAHWTMYKCDERPSMVMAPHEAEVMLRVHLEKVYSNFSPEIKALIISER